MNARPWYRWHWLTYLLLLITGGAVAYLQAFGSYGWGFGWPFTFVYEIRRVGLPAEVTWYPIQALGDFAVCIFILGSVAYCSEYVLRHRFRITIGSSLMFVMSLALAFSWAGWEYDLMSQGRYRFLSLSRFLPYFLSTAWAPLPIRVIIWSAIACTFNVVAWGVLRFSVQCARLVSRRLTAEA